MGESELELAHIDNFGACVLGGGGAHRGGGFAVVASTDMGFLGRGADQEGMRIGMYTGGTACPSRSAA